MGTHPIFESDFDCLTEKYVRPCRCPSSTPSTNSQGLCSNYSSNPGGWLALQDRQRLRHGLHFLLLQEYVDRCQALRGARWPLNEAPYLLRSITLIFNLPPSISHIYFESITFSKF